MLITPVNGCVNWSGKQYPPGQDNIRVLQYSDAKSNQVSSAVVDSTLVLVVEYLPYALK